MLDGLELQGERIIVSSYVGNEIIKSYISHIGIQGSVRHAR